MDYKSALEFINGSFVSFQTAGKSAYREGLESITAMCKALGRPQEKYKTIHIAGTNGKGSVSHMLASVLRAEGYRTGLFTSPHLHDFRERIRVDGEMIPEVEVARFVEEHGGGMTELGLSYFEMTASMAFWHFERAGVDVAVIETGLGGRLDATNIIVPVLSIITNIGLDHTDILGDTLPCIAAEKAGIIKPGVPVVIGESNPETDQVFASRAAKVGSAIHFADREYMVAGIIRSPKKTVYTIRRLSDGIERVLDLDLPGDYQAHNIITLNAVVDALNGVGINITEEAMEQGTEVAARSTGLVGRWQVLAEKPLMVADTAHNVHGMKYVAAQIARQQYAELYMVIGFMGDKDLREILPMLPRKAHYIFTQAVSSRAMPANKLSEIANGYGLSGEVVPDVEKAFAMAQELARPDDMIFVGGSSYVVAEIVKGRDSV